MIPFFDYRPDPQFLLRFAELVLSVASALFNALVAIGPFGIAVVFLIPTILFSINVFKGKEVDA